MISFSLPKSSHDLWRTKSLFFTGAGQDTEKKSQNQNLPPEVVKDNILYYRITLFTGLHFFNILPIFL